MDLNNIHTLLEDSDDMPELRKNLCLSLIKEVESMEATLEYKDELIAELNRKLSFRYELHNWFRNDWPGVLLKRTCNTLILGSVVIVLCAGGLRVLMHTYNTMNAPRYELVK
jgi:hypothetical protein